MLKTLHFNIIPPSAFPAPAAGALVIEVEEREGEDRQ